MLDAFLQLHDSLVGQNPEISAQQNGAAPADDSAGEPGGAGWQRLERSYAAVAPFRDESLDRWYRKTLLGNGLALNSNLRMLNQSISGQVGALPCGHVMHQNPLFLPGAGVAGKAPAEHPHLP